MPCKDEVHGGLPAAAAALALVHPAPAAFRSAASRLHPPFRLMQLPSSVATLRPMHTFHPALQLFPSGLSGPRLEEVRFVEMVGGSGNAALGLLRDCPKLHSLAVAGPQSMMGEREQGRTKLAAPGGECSSLPHACPACPQPLALATPRTLTGLQARLNLCPAALCPFAVVQAAWRRWCCRARRWHRSARCTAFDHWTCW